MSDARPHEFFTSAEIPFVPGTGFVGMGTVPGVVAQPVVALRIEAETDVFEDEAMETIWLKARLHGHAPGQGDSEFLMCAGRARELEPVIAALAEAATGRSPMTGLRLPGAYQGYHNRAQIEADPEITEECREGLSAEVRKLLGGQGVELVLRDAAQRKAFGLLSQAFSAGGADRAVTRLNATFEPTAAATLLAEFDRLKLWQDGMRAKVEAYLDGQPAASAPGL